MNDFDVITLSTYNRQPLYLTLELLTQCNWHCKHCYIPSHGHGGLSYDKIIDIIDQARDLGVIELTLTGGEPFLREDIFDIVEYARRRYMEVVILSNISLLDKVKIRRLKQLYIKKISCSLFSMNNSIHDNITGVEGSLDNSLENLKLLKEEKIPVEIKTVIMQDNLHEYTSIAEFCRKNTFLFQASPNIKIKTNHDFSPANLRLSQEQLISALWDRQKHEITHPIHHKTTDFICPAIRYSITISSHGEVVPCDTFYNTIPFGNILNTTLDNIWHSSENLLKIQNLTWGDIPKCINCYHESFCFKCPGIALTEEGNIDGMSISACSQADIRHKLFMERSGTNEGV